MLRKVMVLLVTFILLTSTVTFAAYPDGIFIGEADGQNGLVQVEVTVLEGKIVDIRVLSSQDTPIISDTAFAEVSQAILDTQELEVETVTAATVSSRAMMSAVSKALTSPGLADGVYDVVTNGHNGPVEFRIVISDGRIREIDVIESSETPIISDTAFDTVSKAIIATQGTDVDTVSAATASSRAMIAAVNTVLQKAQGSREFVLTDGVFEGVAQGFNGLIKVRVTVQESELTAIDVLEHTETVGLGDRALDTIIPRIIEAQSVEVDAISGATFTSEALMDAVKDALQ